MDMLSSGNEVGMRLDTHSQKSRAKLSKTGALAQRRKPSRSLWYVGDGQDLDKFRFTDSTQPKPLRKIKEEETTRSYPVPTSRTPPKPAGRKPPRAMGGPLLLPCLGQIGEIKLKEEQKSSPVEAARAVGHQETTHVQQDPSPPESNVGSTEQDTSSDQRPGGDVVDASEPPVEQDRNKNWFLLVVGVIGLFSAVVIGYDRSGDILRDFSSNSFPAASDERCGPREDQPCDKYLMSQLDMLSKRHKGQSDHLWNTLLAAALDHVTPGSVLKRPIVIMALYDSRGRQSKHRTIIEDVAKVYHNVLWPNVERDIIKINGRELEDVDAETVQRKIEEEFRSGYEEEGKRAVIVYDFDSLPSCSIITFHNLCNKMYAPYLEMAVILAVEKGDVGAVDNTNLEDVVSKKFHERWKDCPEDLPPGEIDAILSNVANNVVLLM